MRPTMVRNFVTFLRRPRNDLRMFRDVFADHEERCLDVVRSQQIEYFWGQRRARSVVKGHRDIGPIDMDRVECNARFLRRGSSLSCCTSLFWRGFRFKPKAEA